MNTNNPRNEIAVFAAGCFWGVQELLRAIPGVRKTTVGYCGGDLERPTYSNVKKGNTFHTEAVRIEFDPEQVTYSTLLDYFFRLHNPTTKNQQGNDIGTQYRSVIFYQNEAQREAAERKKTEVDRSGKWPKPIVTEIVAAKPFWDAEEEHQDYLQKYPNGYTCHYLRD